MQKSDAVAPATGQNTAYRIS